MAQRFDAVLYSQPDAGNLPATQFDKRNITSTRYIEIGTNNLNEGAEVPVGTPAPSLTVSLSELLGFYSHDPSRSQRIITIGVEGYSIRRSEVVPPQDFEPLALVCEQIQQYMDSRYLSILPSDFGQGLANTGLGVTLTDNQAPAIITFRVGKLSADVNDSTLYHPNSNVPVAGTFAGLPNQRIRAFSIRLFVRATYEPNQIPVAGTKQGGPPLAVMSRMAQVSDPFSTAFRAGGGGGGGPLPGGAPGGRDDYGALGREGYDPDRGRRRPEGGGGPGPGPRLEQVQGVAQGVAGMASAFGAAGFGDEPPREGEVDAAERDLLSAAAAKEEEAALSRVLKAVAREFGDDDADGGDDDDDEDEDEDEDEDIMTSAARPAGAALRPADGDDDEVEEVVVDGVSRAAAASRVLESAAASGAAGGGDGGRTPYGSVVSLANDLVAAGMNISPASGSVFKPGSSGPGMSKDIAYFYRSMEAGQAVVGEAGKRTKNFVEELLPRIGQVPRANIPLLAEIIRDVHSSGRMKGRGKEALAREIHRMYIEAGADQRRNKHTDI